MEKKLRVALAADDTNGVVTAVREYLLENHTLVEPAGTDNWVDMSVAVAEAVVSGEVDYGVLLCWTGTGTAIAANKVPGIRAAQAGDAWIAEHARRWNDANILTLSLKRTPADVAVECVQAFLSVTEPDMEESENIAKLDVK